MRRVNEQEDSNGSYEIALKKKKTITKGKQTDKHGYHPTVYYCI